MMIRLFKDGDHMGISTIAPTKDAFLQSFAMALSDLIDAGNYASDWEFQLQYWLRYAAHVCTRYDGFSCGVNEYDCPPREPIHVGNTNEADCVYNQPCQCDKCSCDLHLGGGVVAEVEGGDEGDGKTGPN